MCTRSACWLLCQARTPRTGHRCQVVESVNLPPGFAGDEAAQRLEAAREALPQLVGEVNAILVLVAACPSRRRGAVRDVSMGLVTRVANMFDSILALGPRYESALVLMRCLTESTVNLIFLQQSGAQLDVARRFKRASLYEDRLVLAGLDVHEPPLDGAKRMLGSVLRDAVGDMQAVWSVRKDDRAWSSDRSVEARTRRIGRMDLYDHVYRPLSSCVHGRWAALAALDLQIGEGGRLSPRLDRGRYHIGFAITACWVSLQAADAYLSIANTATATRLRESVSLLAASVNELDQLASGGYPPRGSSHVG